MDGLQARRQVFIMAATNRPGGHEEGRRREGKKDTPYSLPYSILISLFPSLPLSLSPFVPPSHNHLCTDIIDPAVLRPGRLDKLVYVGLPSDSDRANILNTITKVLVKYNTLLCTVCAGLMLSCLGTATDLLDIPRLTTWQACIG